MFRGLKLRGAGIEAITTVGSVAQQTFPFVVAQLSFPLDRSANGLPALAYKVFLAEYLMQNVWKLQLAEKDALHFSVGMDAAFNRLEKKLSGKLFSDLESLSQLWRGKPPQEAYQFTMGKWYLESIEVADPSSSIAPEAGRVLVESARRIAQEMT
jgi:hypothetical protein